MLELLDILLKNIIPNIFLFLKSEMYFHLINLTQEKYIFFIIYIRTHASFNRKLKRFSKWNEHLFRMYSLCVFQLLWQS